jgi:CubicO group peptidase (beta-lactamase class C family)
MRASLMSGFPPPAEGQVTLANWRTAPFNRWAFHHVREIVPSADIPHDPARVRPLGTRGGGLDALRIGMPDGASAGLDSTPDLGLDDFLAATGTDGIVVLHRGAIVLERYANGMTERSPHILMSVTKSMLGLLAAVLAAQGALDIDRLAVDYVPELRETAWAGARVGQLLDMRTAVAFDEDYLATSGPIVAYRKATGWNPLEPGDRATDLRSFLLTLTQSTGPHGGKFSYVSPNTDLLGWIIERAAGRRYSDLMSELVWQPMGAAEPAYITVDRLGAPRCAGGMCTTTRDLARIGQLVVEGGARGARQVVPAAWIEDITFNGDAEAWNAGSFVPYFPGAAMHYRNKWYVERGAAPLLFGLGIHGQNLFIDAKREIVIAKHSSQAAPLDAGLIALTGRFVSEVRKALS